MGNGGSSKITINLDRPNLLYFAGEIVSGTAELNLTEGTVEADEIYMQMTGETGYTTTRIVRDNHYHTRTQTDHHNTPIYSAKTILAQPDNGEKEIVLGPGQYSWPFEIKLIDNLPPTINEPNSYPHVRYYFKVVIDKAWYKPNTTEIKYFTIFPRVNILQNPQCLPPTIFENHNRKDLTLKGTLDKSGYVSGELIHIKLDIENPQRILIRNIDVSMLQSFRIGQNSRGYNMFKTTLPDIMDSKDEHTNGEYSIQVPPVSIAPSYQFQGPSQGIFDSGAFVNISYMLRFSVNVEGMFTNFDVVVPFTIGTEPNPGLNHQETGKSAMGSYSENPEQSMFTDHDQPPSYDSVMEKNE